MVIAESIKQVDFDDLFLTAIFAQYDIYKKCFTSFGNEMSQKRVAMIFEGFDTWKKRVHLVNAISFALNFIEQKFPPRDLK